MSQIGGFSKAHPYHRFEDKMTLELDKLSRKEVDPDISEMIRLQILKTRVWCRDYWTAIGKEIPPNVTFSEI